MNTFKELTDHIVRFRDARDWAQYHKPKEVAISITIEAAELLEMFQWERRSKDEYIREHKVEIGDELADVFIYLLILAHDLGIDIGHAIQSKLGKMRVKYPIEKARGRDTKYTEL